MDTVSEMGDPNTIDEKGKRTSKRYNDWPYGGVNNSYYHDENDTQDYSSNNGDHHTPMNKHQSLQPPTESPLNTVNSSFFATSNDQILSTLIERQNSDLKQLNDELKKYNQTWHSRMTQLQQQHRSEQKRFLMQGSQYASMYREETTQYYMPPEKRRDEIRHTNNKELPPAYIKRVNYEEKHYQKHGVMPADVF